MITNLHAANEAPIPGVMPKMVIDRKSDLYKASLEMESLFVNMMLKAMRETVPKTGFNDGGFAEDIFEDMLYEERAKSMSQTANFGLADTLYRQFAYLRELPSATPGTTG